MPTLVRRATALAHGRRLIGELLDEQAKRLFDVAGRAGVDADTDVARRAGSELDQFGKERDVRRRVSAILPCSSSDQLTSVTSNRSGSLLALRNVTSALVADARG
jgi:hypothetical protein